MTGEQFNLRYTALRRAFIERDFEKLNDMQKKAVLYVSGPLLILAGAGSGKTTVLINRIVNILKYGSGYEQEQAPENAGEEELRFLTECVCCPEKMTEQDRERATELCAHDPAKPWEIIAITFTNKAAGELKERLEKAIGSDASAVWAHTFHSACMRMLRRDIEKLGYSSDFTVYDEEDKKKILTEIIKELNLDEKRFDPRGVSSEISRSKDGLGSAAKYAEECGSDFYRQNIAKIYQAYEKRMKTANALDFDDIIVKTVELLSEYPEVLDYYRHKFKYVLIDEYQDTNRAQYALSRMLAGGYGNICVVGDDDQGIYKFRGATIENILQFEKNYDNARIIRLEQNYRSTKYILEAANGVIANNKGRKGKSLWTANNGGDKVKFFRAADSDDEATYIASKILDAYGAGVNLCDIAILYRNNVLSNAIESALKRNGIPYRVLRGKSFFERAEVKDMIAYLWVISNPSDDLRLLRIINNPARKIGLKTLETVKAIASEQGVSMYEIIKNARIYPELSRASEQLTAFSGMIEELRAAAEGTLTPEFYTEVLQKTGYEQMLCAKNDDETVKRRENVRELASTFVEYCGRAEQPTLGGLMEEISLFTDIDKYDKDAAAVSMLTMHAAKGLEFPYVFICGAEEGIFPSFRAMESEEETEEERRLCYVAMTRAKKELYICSAARRMMYGQTKYADVSRFVSEIPESCVERSESEQLQPKFEFGRSEAHGGFEYSSERSGKNFVDKSLLYKNKPAAAKSFARGSTILSDKKESSSDAAKIAFACGDIVQHKAFGRGMITAATPMGGDLLIEVAFDKAGTKRLMAKNAAKFMTKA